MSETTTTFILAWAVLISSTMLTAFCVWIDEAFPAAIAGVFAGLFFAGFVGVLIDAPVKRGPAK